MVRLLEKTRFKRYLLVCWWRGVKLVWPGRKWIAWWRSFPGGTEGRRKLCTVPCHSYICGAWRSKEVGRGDFYGGESTPLTHHGKGLNIYIDYLIFHLNRQQTYAYQGVRNFSENLACFVFLRNPFWDSPFRLITDNIKLTMWTNPVQSTILKMFSGIVTHFQWHHSLHLLQLAMNILGSCSTSYLENSRQQKVNINKQ